MPQPLKCRSKRSAWGFSRKPVHKTKFKKNSFHKLHDFFTGSAGLKQPPNRMSGYN